MKTFATAFLAGTALLAGVAGAQTAIVATTASDISVRSGPGDDYPEIGVATRGSGAVIDGCLADSNWCRIDVNGMRGWAYAEYLTVQHNGGPVILEEYRSELSVPVVSFETTGSIEASPSAGDELIGRVEDVDAITPPETVITYIEEHPVDPVYLDGDVALGATLPPETTFIEIPDYEYRYVRVNDVPVLVDPGTRRIVYVYR